MEGGGGGEGTEQKGGREGSTHRREAIGKGAVNPEACTFLRELSVPCRHCLTLLAPRAVLTLRSDRADHERQKG